MVCLYDCPKLRYTVRRTRTVDMRVPELFTVICVRKTSLVMHSNVREGREVNLLGRLHEMPEEEELKGRGQ